LGLFGADSKAALRADKDRPGLVGLRIEQMIQDGSGDETRKRKNVSVHWLDPAKDDLPVELVWQTYTPKGDKVETEAHITYTAYAKTDDGRWYPSAWRAVVKTTRRATIKNSTEAHMQLWSGRKLGAEWFDDPVVSAKAKKQQTPTMAPSPQ